MDSIELQREKEIVRQKTAKPLLWVGMAGMTMIFIAATSAYLVRQADSDWLAFELPVEVNYSTIVIVLSTLSLIFADISARKNNMQMAKYGLGLTFLLSLVFVWSQFHLFGVLADSNMNFTGANISSSFLNLLIGLHLAHVFGGNISLGITFFNSLRNKYSANNKLGIELVSWYWHYLTGIWLFLLTFLIIIK
jgi:cytochrome c oxidase subunit 3